MHDGSVATLSEVIDFYDRGGIANPQRDAELRPLRLTATERQALEAFLRALSGTVQEGLGGLTAVPQRLSFGFGSYTVSARQGSTQQRFGLKKMS